MDALRGLQPGEAGRGLQLLHAAQTRNAHAQAEETKTTERPTPNLHRQGQRTPGRLIGQLFIDIDPEPQADHHQHRCDNRHGVAQGALVHQQQQADRHQAGHLPVDAEQPQHQRLATPGRPDQ